MEVFVKPNGVELKVNDTSRSHALSLGWKPKSEVEAEAKAKADEKKGKKD